MMNINVNSYLNHKQMEFIAADKFNIIKHKENLKCLMMP